MTSEAGSQVSRLLTTGKIRILSHRVTAYHPKPSFYRVLTNFWLVSRLQGVETISPEHSKRMFRRNRVRHLLAFYSSPPRRSPSRNGSLHYKIRKRQEADAVWLWGLLQGAHLGIALHLVQAPQAHRGQFAGQACYPRVHCLCCAGSVGFGSCSTPGQDSNTHTPPE